MSRTTARVRVTSGAALALASLLVAGPAYASATATTTSSGTPTTGSSTSSSTSTSSTTASSTTASSSTASTAGGTTTAPATTTTATSTAPTTAPTTTPATTSSTSTTTAGAGTSAAQRTARSYGLAAAGGPSTSTQPSEVGGGYLARQLAASGGYFWNEFGGVKYGDYGLTLDAVLALDAAGVGQAAATTATTYVANHVGEYVGTGGEQYAGATAKALNAAVAQKVDPTAFGGVNLVAQLQGLEDPTGRFSDASAYGDYSNTFSQSFAVLGLHRAGAGPSAQAVAFLRAQQCPGGGIRLQEATTPCTDDTTADVDSTSLAVQALIAVAGPNDAGVMRALDWLTAQQQSNGGFGGSAPTNAVNANSTGLAAQALLAGGRSAAARKAVTYLTGLQYGCGFPAALRGGVAYNSASFAAQQSLGSKAVPDDQDRRSTAQAVPALAGTPLTVVTADGATSNAPTLACAAASSSTTTSSAPRTSTATRATVAGAGSTVGSAGTTGSTGQQAASALAYTGADVAEPLAIAVLLLVLGTLAVVLGRRRAAEGEHS